jgi:hypothetical protein
MTTTIKLACLAVFLLLSGCAHINFDSGKGLTYFDIKPFFLVSTTQDCVTTATVVAIPSGIKHIKFESGYGSADLSATLNNGMIVQVGQKTDTKLPETITAATGLTAVAAPLKEAKKAPRKQVICKPEAKLYPIDIGEDGQIKIQEQKPVVFPVTEQTFDPENGEIKDKDK